MLKIDFYTVEYSTSIWATGRLILYSGSYWVVPRGFYEFHPDDDDYVEVGHTAPRLDHQIGRLN